MWRETNLFGVFLPPLIVYVVSALAAYLPLRWLLNRLDLFRLMAHPSLAGAAIYMCILALLVRWF